MGWATGYIAMLKEGLNRMSFRTGKKMQLLSTLATVLLLGLSSVFPQDSDEKELVLSARSALKSAKKNKEYCNKIGFPASAQDNRCLTLVSHSESNVRKSGFSEGLAKVSIGGKFGYIDKDGKLVIPATLKESGRFSNGLAPFEDSNGKWGFINRIGKKVIPARFDWAIEFKEGLALVQIGELWGFIDPAGNLVIEPKFGEADSFSEGVAAVGWYDKDLEWQAAIPRKGRWVRRFIDKAGKWAVDEEFDSINRGFNNGLAVVARSLGYSEKFKGMLVETYVIDRAGRELWSLNSSSVYSFSDDVIKVEVERKEKGYSLYNFRDRSGQLLCGSSFDDIDDFSEGLVAVRVQGMYGFMDKRCDMVIAPQFSSNEAFSEGLAWVRYPEGPRGFIDRTGNLVIQSNFESAGPFSEGFAVVIEGGKLGYIDRAGKIIWKPTK